MEGLDALFTFDENASPEEMLEQGITAILAFELIFDEMDEQAHDEANGQ